MNDADTVPASSRRTAAQKVAQLELMLGQIANYCPVISRNTIVKNSTSVDNIWQSIRTHYGFQSTGGDFLDLADIKLEQGECPEDLYQCLMEFVEDNLLTTSGGIKHHEESPNEDEDISPTLENVLLWLKLTHSELPHLVKQRYGTELRSRTLASIKPEISQALDSLLEELPHSEEARVMRSAGRFQSQRPSSQFTPRRSSKAICPICKHAGCKSYNHFLSKCPFLPESDQRFLTRADLIAAIEEEDQFMSEQQVTDIAVVSTDSNIPTITRSIEVHNQLEASVSRRVQITQSPYINVFYQHYPVKVVIDSGAETNMIRESVARQIGIPNFIKPSVGTTSRWSLIS